MFGLLSVSQAAVLALVLWAFWRLVRFYVLPSTLDNVPGPEPSSIIWGDITKLFGSHSRAFHMDLWRRFPPVVKIKTFLGQRMLYVYDPKAMHHIIVKDQYLYEETPTFLNFNRLVFGPSLLSSLGEEHRQQRKLLNPVFHINHMRHMSTTFYRITHRLRNTLRRKVSDGPKEIEMLDWITRTALELLAQGGLGTSFDTLDDDNPHPLVRDLKALVPSSRPFFILARFLPIERLARVGSAKLRRWVVDHIPSRRLHRVVAIVDHLENVNKGVLARKKAALAAGDEAVMEQVGEGKDIMSVLLKANMKASEHDKMSDEELLGHMSSLMFAAMETTSGALARILHLLAQHPEVQEKLRQEIIEARRGGDVDYDELVALPYLEAVCRESMRVHSPAGMMSRMTREDVVLPLSSPIKGNDGTMMNEIAVPKDTVVTIGILASNCNQDLWGPDALEWKPERWLKPLPETVTEAHIPGVYSNLMTFLGGGRACIGFKFSQMEMKIVLSVLLETFRFKLSDKEVTWNLGGLQAPAVGKDGRAEMPLVVELVSPQ